MKIHKLAIISLSFALCLSACGKKEEEENNSTLIKPVVSGEYGYLLSNEVSDTRYIHNSYRASKSDPLDMGYGAQQLAKKYFDPKKVLIQEGNVLSNSELERQDNEYNSLGLLKYKTDINPEGLNPEKGTPIDNGNGVAMYNAILVSDIYEIDYVQMNGSTPELVGFTFVIVLSDTVNYREAEVDEDGNVKLDSNGEVILKEGFKKDSVSSDQLFTYGSVEAGQRLVNYLRNSHPEVGNLPIHVTLYQAPDGNSNIPGHFIGEAFVEDRVSSYTKVNQEWVFLPSERMNQLNGLVASQYGQLKSALFKNFPVDVGLWGKGFFEENSLKSLKLEVKIQAKTYTEVQSLVQYMVELCSYFTDTSYSLKVDMKSDDETVAILSRASGSSDVLVTLN